MVALTAYKMVAGKAVMSADKMVDKMAVCWADKKVYLKAEKTAVWKALKMVPLLKDVRKAES